MQKHRQVKSDQSEPSSLRLLLLTQTDLLHSEVQLASLSICPGQVAEIFWVGTENELYCFLSLHHFFHNFSKYSKISYQYLLIEGLEAAVVSGEFLKLSTFFKSNANRSNWFFVSISDMLWEFGRPDFLLKEGQTLVQKTCPLSEHLKH